MYPSIDKLKSVLLGGNYISEEDGSEAEKAAHDGTEFVGYLVKQDLLSKTILGQALAESYGVPFINLDANPPTKKQVEQIPEAVAREERVVFVRTTDHTIVVASDDPENVDAKKVEALFKNTHVQLAYTLPEYVETAFSMYAQPLATRFSAIIETGQRIAPEIVEEIIKDAINSRASDIHFEPGTSMVIVRFRVDGVLRVAGALPKEYYESILNRIKVESGMRIDEHQSAQDGAMQRQDNNYATDLRVSLVPTVMGEKVVMRLLGSYVHSYDLNDIGLGDKQRKAVDTFSAKPFGMILSTGPTGSGKTTTLYALLKILNRSNVNITSIEDPVEYKLLGVNQIQVREASNLTFAKGLRSIVRQDPDIILVGEIRDRETAEISVNAALTGHLLLSSFHANDAATAVPRLIEMGIEPFLLSSTLNLIISQRLVRKICSNCRYSLPITSALKELNPSLHYLARYFTRHDNVYAGKGCAACNHTGFNGRTAIFEMIEVTQAMQELILTSPSAQQVGALARKQGDIPMFEDGIDKVKGGVTTLAELVRVVEPPAKPGAPAK